MTVSKEIAGRQGRKGLKVVFTSDKKRIGGGAQCTAQCIDPAPTTTPTPGTVESPSPSFGWAAPCIPIESPSHGNNFGSFCIS